VGPREGFLQLLQLEGGEGGPVAPLLPHLMTSCLLYVLNFEELHSEQGGIMKNLWSQPGVNHKPSRL
jgi:hypothetical protein